MGEFSITAESVETGAKALFTASESIYEAMSTLSSQAGELEGSAEAGGFTGVAECVQAAQIWESNYVAVHRADIEDAAMSAAVSASSSEEVDGYVSSMFDQYSDSYFPEGRNFPAPVRPDPDPSVRMARDGESVAV
jgi:hypothetical protein